MKLLSETRQEDQLVVCISALLQDLGVDIETFESSETLALVFWNADDFALRRNGYSELSYDDRIRFLSYIEEDIRSAMILAGLEAIEEGIRKYIS